MTRCSVCRRFIWPWQSYGLVSGREAWHVGCKPDTHRAEVDAAYEAALARLGETPVATLYERNGRLVLRRRAP